MNFFAILTLTILNCANIIAQFIGGGVEFHDREDPCRTSSGTCVLLSQCPEFVNDLRKPGHPTNEDIVKLRRATCGFEQTQAKVCCPTSVPAPAAPSRSTEGSDSLPNVTNHPNLHLLDSRLCGVISRDRIIGGNKTGVFDYPWMALIAHKIRNMHVEFRCGGTIITDRYILTAAHCVTQLPSGVTLIGARVGEHDLRTERDCNRDKDGLELECAERYQDFGISEVNHHPNFSQLTLRNDIALIRVDAPIDFRPANARPICLPIGSAVRQHQGVVVVTGWGATENGPRSQDLLQVKLSLVSNENCADAYKAYRRTVTIGKQQMCAGGVNHQDSCLGDSGGPLQAPSTYNNTLIRFVQYGIVSFGPNTCSREGYPGVYTRLTYYTDWILDHLRQ